MCRVLMLSLIVALVSQEAGAAVVDEQADSLSRRTKVVAVDSGRLSREEIDSVYHVIASFYYDQFRHAQDPNSPYFMFLSKETGMMMGIGGVVRMRGW